MYYEILVHCVSGRVFEIGIQAANEVQAGMMIMRMLKAEGVKISHVEIA